MLALYYLEKAKKKQKNIKYINLFLWINWNIITLADMNMMKNKPKIINY
jgi:hypothetical protein